nr:hypothetical protein [Paramuribaculum sp.]
TNNPVTVDGGKLYRFFDRFRADNPAVVDEVELTCEDLLELNDLYILYSPTEFQLPAVDNGNGYEIKNLSLKNFHKWLSASRTHNHEIQLKTIHITIQNQQK